MYCDVVNVQPQFNLSDEILILNLEIQKTRDKAALLLTVMVPRRPGWVQSPWRDPAPPLSAGCVWKHKHNQLFKPISVAGWHTPTEWVPSTDLAARFLTVHSQISLADTLPLSGYPALTWQQGSSLFTHKVHWLTHSHWVGTQHWPGSKVPHCSLTKFTGWHTPTEWVPSTDLAAGFLTVHSQSSLADTLPLSGYPALTWQQGSSLFTHKVHWLTHSHWVGTQHWPGSRVPHCSLTNFTGWHTPTEWVPSTDLAAGFLTVHSQISLADSHSQHCFSAPSSKLCQIWLHHWGGTLYLRAAVHRRG